MNKQATKAAAHKAFQENRLQDARELFMRVCSKDKADADCWFLLGATHGQLGALEEAERCFRKVVALLPSAFAAWDNLGIALLHQQRLDEAEDCFRRALRIQPGFAGAHNNLGNVLRLRGRLREAEAAIRRALELDPASALAHNNLAIIHLEQGDLVATIEHARRALAINRRYPDAYHNLGEALCIQGRFDEALPCYQAALQLDPDQLKTILALASLLEQSNRRDEAIQLLARTLEQKPDTLVLHLQLARLHMDRKNLEGALHHYESARRIKPDSREAATGLAALCAFERRHQEALELLQPFLEDAELDLATACLYADLSPHVGRTEDALARLERLNSDSPAPEFRRGGLYFALARLHERLGHFDQAFHYYQLGNRARPLPSDLAEHLRQMERIRNVFSPDTRSRLARSGTRSSRPVFIVGMPRSGTSLVEQILASHSEVHGGGELTDLWALVNGLPALTGTAYPECVPGLTQAQVDGLAQQYLGRLESLAPGARRVTDKLPHNFLHLGLIEQLFPDARVIHCSRDPRDTCLSIYCHDFNLNNLYARDLHELGRYHRAYAQLMDHWRQEAGIPILDIRYEDLVEDLEGHARKMIDFCGLEWQEACLRFHEAARPVFTPSRDQVRQPIYRSAVGRWRNYAEFLQPLREGLGSPPDSPAPPGHDS